MAAMEDIVMSSNDDISLPNVPVSVAGGVLTGQAPAFSADSRYFFVCSSSRVKMYSVASGQCLRTLSGHTATVRGVALNPTNTLQLYSWSDDGTLRLWDFHDAVILKTYRFPNAIIWLDFLSKYNTVVAALHTPEGKALVVHAKLRGNTAAAAEGNLDLVDIRNTLFNLSEKKLSTGSSASSYAFSLTANKEIVVCVSGKKLQLCRVADCAPSVLYHKRAMVCVACHPSESIIATGDSNGAITLWRNVVIGDSPSGQVQPVRTEMHWHAHAVQHVSFSMDGAYLLSGGEEAVLVLWQLETGHRQFLPRLSAPILHVSTSPDSTSYAVAHANNSIRLVASIDLHIQSVVNGLQSQGVMVTWPRSDTIVAIPSSTVGHVQLFDVERDMHVSEIDVTRKNYISRTNASALDSSTVLLVAFSSAAGSVGKVGAAWAMATVERRGGGGDDSNEPRLKFWAFEPDTMNYVLTTVVDTPHSSVTAMQFSPLSALFATAGTDGKFKIWMAEDINSGKDENSGDDTYDDQLLRAWSCSTTGFYRGDSKCGDLSFSEDGSLLAVSFDSTITLWEPTNNVLATTLAHSPASDVVISVGFISNTSYLVSTTGTHIYVWDLLSCSVWWSYAVSVNKLVMDPLSSDFAAIFSIYDKESTGTRSQYMIRFSDGLPKPTAVTPLGDINVASVVFSGPAVSRNVVLMNNERQLFVFSKPSADNDSAVLANFESLSATRASIAAESVQLKHENGHGENVGGLVAASAFSKVFRKGIIMDSSEASFIAPLESEAKATNVNVGLVSLPNVMFNGPAHALPSMAQLFTAGMEHLLDPVRVDSDFKNSDRVGEESSDEEESDNEDQPVVPEIPTIEQSESIECVLEDILPTEFDFMVNYFERALLLTTSDVTAATPKRRRK